MDIPHSNNHNLRQKVLVEPVAVEVVEATVGWVTMAVPQAD